jgi:UPF0755 protein
MKFLLKIIVLILIVMIGGWIWLGIMAEKDNKNPYGDKKFVVNAGDTTAVIGKKLKAEGFISSRNFFSLYSRLKGLDSHWQVGEYKLNTTLSVKEIVNQLTRKDWNRAQKKLTFIEGWTRENMAAYLEREGLFPAADFMKATEKASSYDYEFLQDAPAGVSLEGFLYPDTYNVYEDATPEEVVIKMLNNFDNKLTNDLRVEIAKQKKKVYDIAIMASIVEKEMFGYDNRRIVADIFWSRLRDGMALQSDATISYFTKNKSASASLDETKIDNPYNTYKYQGLPPTPICNPSIESIQATILPTDSPYYYFLTTPDGKIIFSKTHEEHVANKYKYLK